MQIVKRWVVPGLLVCGAVVAVAALSQVPHPEEAPEPADVPVVNVVVEELQARPELADTLLLSAVIEPGAIVDVAAEVPGRVETYGAHPVALAWRGHAIPAGKPVEEGDPIKVGQPLVHLNRELLEAQYERAQAQADYDQLELERITDLYERNVTTRAELDEARNARNISLAALKEAQRQLERTTIVAPRSGILDELPLELGEYAAPGTLVARIVDLSEVKVAVDVPEKDIDYFRVGQIAEVLPRTSEAAPRIGIITYISEIADPATRTSRVEITLENRAMAFRSGQIVRVRLTRRVLQDALLIPLEAVIPLEEGRVVYVCEDGRAQRRNVELGMLTGRSVVIESGLQPGEQLIVAGHRYVGPGQPVAIQPAVGSVTPEAKSEAALGGGR